MRTRFLPLLLLLLIPLLASCGDEVSGPTTIVMPRPNEPVVYSKHIEPIFRNSCAGTDCHMNGQIGGDLALDTWDRVMAGTEGGITEVVPFSSRFSHLFQHINTDSTLGEIATPRMPISRDPLPHEQVETIKRWIDEGARNDNNVIALAGVDRPRAFLASRTAGLLTVIDRSTNLIARHLHLPAAKKDGGITSIVCSPDGRYVYAGVPGTGIITRFDVGTLEPVGQVDVGGSVGQIVLSHDGALLYAGNYRTGSKETSIACVDATTMQVRTRIENVGRAPFGLALASNGTALVTANTLGDDVSLVDLANGTVVHRMPVSHGNPLVPGFFARYEPYGVAVPSDTRTAIVACRHSGELRRFDLQNGLVVDSVFVGANLGVPALTPNDGELWVPDRDGNRLVVIDPATLRIVTSIGDISDGPNSIAFTRDGGTAFVTCDRAAGNNRHAGAGVPGALYIINVRTRAILRVIEVAPGAEGAAVAG